MYDVDIPWTWIAIAILTMPAFAGNDNLMEQSITQSASGSGTVQLDQRADSYARSEGSGSSISQDSIQQSTGLLQGADIDQSVTNWVDCTGGNEISADNVQITEGALESSQKIANYGEVSGSGNAVHHHNAQKLVSDCGQAAPEKTKNAFNISGDGNRIDLDNRLDNQYTDGESPSGLSQSTCIDIKGDYNTIDYSNLALGPVMSSIQGYFGVIA